MGTSVAFTTIRCGFAVSCVFSVCVDRPFTWSVKKELWKRNCEIEAEKIKKEAEEKRIKEKEANPLNW